VTSLPTYSVLPMDQASSSGRLDQAAAKAFTLVQEYAEVNDPHSESEDNPWRNPESMYQALDTARIELSQAWQEMQQQQASSNSTVLDDTNTNTNSSDPDDFRALYMDMITDAFADVLENMRETQEILDLDVLVDCLQNGMDLLSADERDGFFQAWENNNDYLEEENEDDTGDKEGLTPHERQRRELGYDLPVSG
jgi:hypothetical protein